jgi:hypothetical protein
MPSTNGFIIGLIGGLLDFASASFLLLGQGGSSSITNGSSVSIYGWAAVLIALGVLVIATSVLSVGSAGTRFGRVFAILMTIYGGTMMLIGAAMTVGYIAATDVSMIYSSGMFLVGAAMLVNGIMMSRNAMPV